MLFKPLNEPNTQQITKNQWSAYKVMIRALIKIRIRQFLPFASQSIIIFVVAACCKMVLYDDEDPRIVKDEITPYFQVTDKYYLYPDCNISYQFRDYIFPYISHQNVIILNDTESYERTKNMSSSFILVNFSQSTELFADIYAKSDLYLSNQFSTTSITSKFAIIFERFLLRNYTNRIIENKIQLKTFKQLDPYFLFYVIDSIPLEFALMLLSLINAIDLFGYKYDKTLMLLNISGAEDLTIKIAHFSLSIILYIVYFIVYTCLSLDMWNHIDISIIAITLFSIFFGNHFLYLIAAAVKEKSTRNYIFFFNILLTIVSPLICLLCVVEVFNYSFLKYVKPFAIFPPVSLALCFLIWTQLNVYYKDGISWKNIDAECYITAKYLLIISVCSLFLFLFLYIFMELMLPRKIGEPPIGFHNIFSAAHWKRLFSNKKYVLEESDSPLITVNNLNKTYYGRNKVEALKDVSFTVNHDEMVVIIGTYSSGKSTLLNTISGAVDNEGGSLMLNGKKCLFGFQEMQNSLGVCFQDNVFFKNLSVKDNLWIFGRLRGISSKLIDSEIELICDKFDITSSMHTKCVHLSGGQARKLCLAIAFIGHPSILILDEPTAGVDVASRQVVWKAISNSNSTCILSSHMLEEAETISNRIFVMSNGRIIFDGTPSDLRQDHHCGYMLKIIFKGENEDDTKIQRVFNWVKETLPDASLDDMHEDCILLPLTDLIAQLLHNLDQKLVEFEIETFNVTISNIEDTLYDMYINS